MAGAEKNYKSINEQNNPFRSPTNNDNDVNIDNDDDVPSNSGMHMIHIVPETSKARWNHIEDLDSFFTRMYNYHQKHGFTVILMDEIFQLCEFSFVVWLLTLTIHCIKYPILFGTDKPEANRTKVYLSDIIIPAGECVDNFGFTTYFILVLAILYFMFRLIKMIYHVAQYADIKKFYNSALHIEDNDLDNITWHEVKKKIREVQTEHHMCIDKLQLTELDIYHRILRFKNYMVALMNKNLLPVRYNVPVFGEVVSLSRGLLYNVNFILFRGPGSPFQNNWQLRTDYTVRSNQAELAHRLSKLILYVAIANFILAPVIFCWQIIYFAFSYANVLRKDAGVLSTRTWSNYGKWYLRHFNELDHELDARLNRAYDYSDRYLSSFSSPVMAAVGRNILFLSGGLLVLILALGIYDEYVFQVEHVLTIITALSAIGLICRALIPDENLIWCPEQLLCAILAHVHYLPSSWKGKAHTKEVQKEFGNFFQYKAMYLLNEICSPITTPFVLIFVFRPKALEIVKFFRSFTVTVKGVGNVCSFAQMDIRKHGNPEWQLKKHSLRGGVNEPHQGDGMESDDRNTEPVENGKTELSLIRFTLTNPEWQMPLDAKNFLKSIREHAVHDLNRTKTLLSNDVIEEQQEQTDTNVMAESLVSFGNIGNQYSAIANSVFLANNIPVNLPSENVKAPTSSGFNYPPTRRSTDGSGFEHMLHQSFGDATRAAGEGMPSENISQSRSMSYSINRGVNSIPLRKMRVNKIEGRLEGPGPDDSLLYRITNDPNLLANPTDITVADMCLSTLYLHGVHEQNVKMRQPPTSQREQSSVRTIVTTSPSTITRPTVVSSATVAEDTPLLGNIRS